MADIMDNFFRGFQLGHGAVAEGRANALRQQELRSREAMRRLEERQVAQEMALKMEAYDMAVQRQADTAKAAAKFQLMTSPVIPTGAGVTIPNPMKRPANQAFMESFLPLAKSPAEAVQIGQAAYDLGRMQEQGFQPIGQAVNLPSGRTVEGVKTSPNSFQILPNTAGGVTETDEERKRRATAMGLTPSGLNAKGEVTYGRPPTKQVIRTRPDGTVEVVSGATSDDISASDRSNLKQRTIKLEDTARRIQPLIENAENIFGAKALAGTVIVDRALANLAPNLAVGQRIQGRQAARYAFEGLIRSLTEGQGALSNKDVERIQSLFPEMGNLGEVLENPARAQNLLRSLQKQLARDAAVDARMLGEKPSPDVLRFSDPVFLLDEFRAGRMTIDELRKALSDNIHKQDVDALAERF